MFESAELGHKIDKATYDVCLDRRDYRLKRAGDGEGQP